MAVSAGRTAALGKYLVTTSRHLASQRDEDHTKLSRRRLHILYLLNDLLHHGKYHASDPALWENMTRSLQPFLVELFQISAAAARPRVSKRLSDLIKFWKEEEYFGQDTVTQFHNALAGRSQETGFPSATVAKPGSDTKELPYILPPTHGDTSLPYYDLPAGNFMQHIVPNSSQSMRPDQIRALQLSAGPADESLIHALKDFLDSVGDVEESLLKLEQMDVSPEIDELGQISYHDEAGDLVGDTYYGWSRSFCEKMKKRGRGRSRESDRRASRSSSRGVTPQKRRRRASSSHPRSRSSTAYGRSTSRPKDGHRRRHWSRSRTRSRSRSRSYSPHYNQSKTVQPPKFESSNFNISRANVTPAPPPQSMPHPAMPIGLPFPPPPFAPMGMPFPPPRPPQWTGPWPPPPPPPSYPPDNSGYQNPAFASHAPPFTCPPNSWPTYPQAPPGPNNHQPPRR